MLLHGYKDFYGDIPWKDTGRPIGAPPPSNKLPHRILRKLKNKAFPKKELPMLDWCRWLNNPLFKQNARDILNADDAILKDFVRTSPLETSLEFHNPQDVEIAARYVTAEGWLQLTVRNDTRLQEIFST